ncbi:MAG: DUF3810 domain-containing protein, partial [Clostridia bacterium]|nr:DUF3810 domain-containing protein [Clostridia bacterium]
FYPVIKSVLGRLSAFFSFSLGEVLVVLLLIVGMILLVTRIGGYRCIRKGMPEGEFSVFVLTDVWTMCNICLVVLVLFQTLWGLNYHQPSLYEQLGLEVQTIDVQTLSDLLEDMAGTMAFERKSLDKRPDGVVTTRASVDEILARSFEIYREASMKYDFIEAPICPPKTLLTASFFSYNGISGIYNPFTGEANINQINSLYMLPAVALHELSHQQGIAKEDEANFIAFFIAHQSDDIFTRYSGHLLLLIYGLNNLKGIDENAYLAVCDGLDEGIKKDMVAHNELWQRYDGPLESAQRFVNDTYLKANGQSSGVEAYNEMVGLYIAWTVNNK